MSNLGKYNLIQLRVADLIEQLEKTILGQNTAINILQIFNPLKNINLVQADKADKIDQEIIVVKKKGVKGRNSRKGRTASFKSAEWFIFTRDGCSYCKKAKELLANNSKKFKEEKITDDNKLEIYDIIDSYTDKYRYFPIIFNKGKFIGGFTELQSKF
jgi:glutaredoxin